MRRKDNVALKQYRKKPLEASCDRRPADLGWHFSVSFSHFFLIPACLVLSACANIENKATDATVEAAEAKAEPVLLHAAESIETEWARKSIEWGLKDEQKAVFKAIETVRPRARWDVFTTSDVKAFVRAFEAGALAPERQFDDPKVDQSLLAQWRATPVKDRVFVAGSQKDTALIDSLRNQLRAQGKVVFFYLFCSGGPGELCASETVGAFFATAGTALVAVTPASTESRYTPNELAAALNLMNRGPSLVLFSPEEVMSAAQRPIAIRVVTVATETRTAQDENNHSQKREASFN